MPFFGALFLKSNSQISEESTNLWYYSDCFFWFWVPGQKRPFVATLIGGTSSLKKPQPDASLSIKELVGSAGAVIGASGVVAIYIGIHWDTATQNVILKGSLKVLDFSKYVHQRRPERRKNIIFI